MTEQTQETNVVERRLNAAIARFRDRRAYYVALGILLVAALVAVIVFAGRTREGALSRFSDVWARGQAAALKLGRGQSAREELAMLENTLAEVRGKQEEGLALWLSAIYNYGEANTPDKITFADQLPFLEKALGYLDELSAEGFDELLLAKPRWFSSASQAPIDLERRQVQSDIEWGRQHATSQPKPDDDLVAVLRTSEGDIHLKFFGKLAPKHRDNFVTLATLGTYNGTNFHFVGGGSEDPVSVMGGDPYSFFYPRALDMKHILRWGSGGVGYDLPPEQSRFEVVHSRATVTSMRRGRGSDWDNGVQFQILLKPNRALDRKHTPFAQIAEGMNVVEKISKRKTAAQHEEYRDDRAFGSAERSNLLVEPVEIYKVIIYRDGKAIEHKYTLMEGEKSLSSLSGTPAASLPPNEIYCGRELRATDAEGEIKRGQSIPFPEDIDPDDSNNPANPKGDRETKK